MPDFIRTENNPLPDGGEIFDFRGADGARLRAALFHAPDARGGVVLMAGRSEFLEKYFEVVRELQARGLSVATMDWRGQGLSDRLLPEREKGHILDFGAFRADLRKFTGGRLVPQLLGTTIGENPALFEAASPIAHVSRDDPPMFLYHGGGDTLVDVSHAE
ncbi:MAG: alpha/beta hydrolase, partial [Parvularculaceae bacterium]|nr:alpha/beta hydrolase [Parvularculaceae bacterium]